MAASSIIALIVALVVLTWSSLTLHVVKRCKPSVLFGPGCVAGDRRLGLNRIVTMPSQLKAVITCNNGRVDLSSSMWPTQVGSPTPGGAS